MPAEERQPASPDRDHTVEPDDDSSVPDQEDAPGSAATDDEAPTDPAPEPNEPA